jgi:hypothetical protein
MGVKVCVLRATASVDSTSSLLLYLANRVHQLVQFATQMQRVQLYATSVLLDMCLQEVMVSVYSMQILVQAAQYLQDRLV